MIVFFFCSAEIRIHKAFDVTSISHKIGGLRLSMYNTREVGVRIWTPTGDGFRIP